MSANSRGHAEAVGEAGRDPELAEVVGREQLAVPAAERRRAAAHVDRDVEDLALDAAHQLALAARGSGGAGRAACPAASASGCPGRTGPAAPGVSNFAAWKISRKKPRSSRWTHGLDPQDARRASVGDDLHGLRSRRPRRAGSRRTRSCPVGAASSSTWSASSQPRRKAISSRQATLRPCRCSIVCDELARPAAATRGCRCRARRCRGRASPTWSSPALEVLAVDVGDLELAARRRLQAARDVDHVGCRRSRGRSPRSGDLGRAGFSSMRERPARARRTRPRRSARGRGPGSAKTVAPALARGGRAARISAKPWP